jgi:hypothetical protein
MYVMIGDYGSMYRVPTALGSNLTPAFNELPDVVGGTGTQYIMHIRPLNGACGALDPASDGYLPPRLTPGMVVRIFYLRVRPRFTTAPRTELPVGTYMDVSWSGVGLDGKFLDDGTDPLMVVFGPDGRVAWMEARVNVASKRIPHSFGTPNQQAFNSFNDCGPYIPKEDIHFLIARQKRPGIATAPQLVSAHLLNLTPDSGSYWVSINPSTGAVTSAENLGSPNVGLSDADILARVMDSRRSARASIRVGGN